MSAACPRMALACRSSLLALARLARAAGARRRRPGADRGRAACRRAPRRLAVPRGGARAGGAAEAAPGAPETSYLDGLPASSSRGDYDGAVRALGAACQAVPAGAAASAPPSRRLTGSPSRRATPSRTTARSARRTPSSATRPRTRCSSRYARDTLEAAVRGAARRSRVRGRRCRSGVEFYRSPSDLAAVSSLSQAEVARTGTIALCKWARLMVTTPRALPTATPGSTA